MLQLLEQIASLALAGWRFVWRRRRRFSRPLRLYLLFLTLAREVHSECSMSRAVIEFPDLDHSPLIASRIDADVSAFFFTVVSHLPRCVPTPAHPHSPTGAPMTSHHRFFDRDSLSRLWNKLPATGIGEARPRKPSAVPGGDRVETAAEELPPRPKRGSRRARSRAAASGRPASRRDVTLAGFDQLESRLAFAVGYATTNDWGTGLQGQFTLTNDTSATLTDWRLSFNYSRSIASIWNAQIVSIWPRSPSGSAAA